MLRSRLSRRCVLLALIVAAPVGAVPPPEDVALYGKWCGRCHGDKGDGRGPAAVALAFNGTAPRDFTRGRFKWKSTPSGAAPTDEDLRRTIARGLPGTAMPSFRDLLIDGEIDRLVGVVRSFDPSAGAPGETIDLGPDVPDSPVAEERGRVVFAELGCGECHGADGQGRGRSASALRTGDGSPARPADLTRPWRFRGGADARDIALRLAAGMDDTPMPSYRDSSSLADLWAVAHYVRSLARAPSLRAAAIEASKGPLGGEGVEPRERGEYLAKSGACFLCHVQMQEDGSYREGSFGAGGMRVHIQGVRDVSTRNLTPDPETGIGRWSAEDFVRAVKHGTSRDGRRLSTLDMPWTIFTLLEDRDVEALYAYFHSLAAVKNRVPPPADVPLREAVLEKLELVLGGGQVKAGFYPGNTGDPEWRGEEPPVVNPRGWLPLAVPAVAGLGIALSMVRRRRIAALFIAVLGIAPVWTYLWPPLDLMPIALVNAEPPLDGVARLLNLPPIRRPPETEPIADPELRTLAARGRTLAALGACPLCHTAGPNLTRLYSPFPELGGGMRVNWRVFGTTFSRNLTPDRVTGLGDWSDGDIRRALTSGISRRGRLMHWQAMPWDHFSKLTLEDQEALIFYLRNLKPARSTVPEPKPPRRDDEPADTFFFGYTGDYRP